MVILDETTTFKIILRLYATIVDCNENKPFQEWNANKSKRNEIFGKKTIKKTIKKTFRHKYFHM